MRLVSRSPPGRVTTLCVVRIFSFATFANNKLKSRSGSSIVRIWTKWR